MQSPSDNCWRTRSNMSDGETCTWYMAPPRESGESSMSKGTVLGDVTELRGHLHQVSMPNKKRKQDRTVGKETLHQKTQEKAQEYRLMYRRGAKLEPEEKTNT